MITLGHVQACHDTYCYNTFSMNKGFPRIRNLSYMTLYRGEVLGAKLLPLLEALNIEHEEVCRCRAETCGAVV